MEEIDKIYQSLKLWLRDFFYLITFATKFYEYFFHSWCAVILFYMLRSSK